MPRDSENEHRLDVSKHSLLNMKINIHEAGGEPSKLDTLVDMEPKQEEGEVVKQSKSTMCKLLEEQTRRKHSAADCDEGGDTVVKESEEITRHGYKEDQVRKFMADLPNYEMRSRLAEILGNSEDLVAMAEEECEKATKLREECMRKYYKSEARHKAQIEAGFDGLDARPKDLGASYPNRTIVVVPQVNDDDPAAEHSTAKHPPSPADDQQVVRPLLRKTGGKITCGGAYSSNGDPITIPSPFTFKFTVPESPFVEEGTKHQHPSPARINSEPFGAKYVEDFGSPDVVIESMEEGEVVMEKALAADEDW